MRLVFFSDTHTKHQKVLLPSGDVLIFCGDLSSRGKLRDVESFARFMQDAPFRHKIAIAGNHDFCFENDERPQAEELLQQAGVIYLNDSGTDIKGKKFWGSPVQPFFHNWAFNRHRGPEIRRHWDMIPAQVDVLITHGPPLGILDRIYRGEQVGCEDLLKKVRAIKPKVHAFGHIHEAYGMEEHGGTVFINACSVDLQLRSIRPPIVFDL